MIRNAKVSLAAVKTFEQGVSAAKDYSPKFERGISCLDALSQFITEQIAAVRESCNRLKQSQDKLQVKIKELEAVIAKLNERINELESKLSSLESELSGLPATISITNEEGESNDIPNPAYVALQAEIVAVEAEIAGVEAEKAPYQERLNRANAVDAQIETQIDKLNSVIYALNEKKNSCHKLREELSEVKSSNSKNGMNAFEKLKRIEEIVAAYLRIKMEYDNAAVVNQPASDTGAAVNINITINKNISEGDRDNTIKTITAEEIAKHNIKFDSYNRICSYDNKSFGGKYNPYDVRLERTSSDVNPILGSYVGERGESKYIPAGRSVEGIKIIEILKEYNLDGIEYRNAEPDFEVCSEAVVKISGMTSNRENYSDENNIPKLGNFKQADIECAKKWNAEKRDNRTDWTGREVEEYRKKHGLTWHEKCDTETMVLVRSEINGYFKHSGGCSECRVRDEENVGGDFDE